MFPSVRRVVTATSAAVPARPLPVACSASAAVAAAAAVTGAGAASASFGRPPSTPGHPLQPQAFQQRRYSSSKPSSPDNGSKALSVPSTSTSTSTSAKADSKKTAGAAASPASPKRKRKAKEPVRAPPKLPSVPSTQYLPIETLALSTFFSQHRPISITHSLPKTVTDDAFASIFAPRGSKSSLAARMAASSGAGAGTHKTSDVIRTLTRSVHDLESPVANMALDATSQGRGRRRDKAEEQRRLLQQQQQQQQEAEDGETDQAINNSAVHMQMSSLSGQFLPFRPPPPPMPLASVPEEVVGAEEAAAADEAEAAKLPTMRTFKAVLNFEKQLDKEGQPHMVASSLQIVEEDAEDALGDAKNGRHPAEAARTFLEQMGMHQLRFKEVLAPAATSEQEANVNDAEEAEDEQSYGEHDGELAPRPDMQAISVRRQKKLKMKKKKYKKLMKRTRTLRRKLDRN